MLEATGGTQPQAQVDLRNSPEYKDELNRGVLDVSKDNGWRMHFQYLSNLVTDQGSKDYGDQVG